MSKIMTIFDIPKMVFIHFPQTSRVKESGHRVVFKLNIKNRGRLVVSDFTKIYSRFVIRLIRKE